MGKGWRVVKWGAIGLGSILLVLIVLAGVGLLLKSWDASAVKPSGQLVDVNGHAMHLMCTGSGDPTVVVEAGSGSWSGDWALVQPQVAEFTRICTYDRSGYGFSEPGPMPRTGEQIVSELHQLLQTAEVPKPYVLVGHSLGGLYARLYQATYSGEVAGMVLVDARPENTGDLPEELDSNDRVIATMQQARSLAQVGLLRIILPYAMPDVIEKLPTAVRRKQLAVRSESTLYDAVLSEAKQLDALNESVRRVGDLGDMPLIVIAHGTSEGMFAPNVPEDTINQFETVWRKHQAELAGLSSVGEMIVAEKSGHNVMLYQPELIVESVRQVVQSLRISDQP